MFGKQIMEYVYIEVILMHFCAYSYICIIIFIYCIHIIFNVLLIIALMSTEFCLLA